jgi:SAM-dependent methyltransferase
VAGADDPGRRPDRRRVAAPSSTSAAGPGRLLEALAAAGKDALGVDLVATAVGIANARGGRAVHGSIFSDVPRAGRWATALLLDGNIGIGGSPAALLARVAAVLAPAGEAVVEVDPPGFPTHTAQVRLESDGAVSDWFAWGRVSADAIEPIARRAALATADVFEDDGRWFAGLRRAG